MNNILENIKKSGIVGAGGAGFPTHIKLNSNCKYIIVNAAECEPLIKVDQQLMKEEIDKILEALISVMTITSCKKAFIGIKGKHKGTIEIIENKIKEFTNIEVYKLDDFYPAGDEQTLTYEILQEIVPEGGIPLDIGTIVINSETLLNIYYSYVENKNVVEKYVTIAGEVKNPMTVKIPIGTKVDKLIEIAGGSTCKDYKVIDGGPMMGKVIECLDTGITKTTKALIVLPSNHHIITTKKQTVRRTIKESKACMNCSMCSEICPRNLLGHNLHPHKLMRIMSYKDTLDCKSPLTTALLCCECRLCEYVCNMQLQPWRVNKLIKEELKSLNIKKYHDNKDLQVDSFKELKKFPVKKLIRRLGISKYDVEAPIINNNDNIEEVVILKNQHIGTTGHVLVTVGEEVIRGQLIIEIMDNQVGANIHASIDGVVHYIDDKEIIIKTMKEVI